jgi:hypothetical protein
MSGSVSTRGLVVNVLRRAFIKLDNDVPDADNFIATWIAERLDQFTKTAK